MGDWPSLGKNASNAQGAAGDQAQADPANKSEVTTGSKGTSDKPSAPKTTPPPPAAEASPQKQPPQPSTDAKPVASAQQVAPTGPSGAAEQPSAAQPKASQQSSPSSAPQNTSTNSVQSTTSNSSQNGPTANGYPAQGNNGNRRVPKSKWVPMDIELPSKLRGKPRERNNNISSSAAPPSERPRRREVDSDADYSSERDPRNTRRYRSTSSRSGTDPIKPRHSTGPPPAGGTATRAPYTNSSSSSAPRPSRGPSSVLSSAHPKRTGPIRSVGGIQKSRPRPVQSHHQNGEFPSDYAVDYTSIKKIVSSGIESGQPFLMPYLGTYYYNGVPSYANMDTTSLKEAIRKQM